MVFFLWFVLFAVIVVSFLVGLAVWRHAIREQYAGARPVACPKDQKQAVAHIDGRYAAARVMDGSPHLRLADCTCWPERAQCNQECLPEALRAEPYKPGEAKSGRKQIYHLPVLLAAFVAWYVGMLWHSHYLFREQWIQAVGLTHAQVKQIVWWLSPHLLTAAICLLFAYGVAWLLALSHRKGVLYGVLMSVLLGGALIATSWSGIARLPHDLFVLEAGYIVLAILVVGVTLGGLYDKIVLRPQ